MKIRIHVISFPLQISKLREEVQKLQVSEAEIKALSFNYAAMLKEKEVYLFKGLSVSPFSAYLLAKLLSIGTLFFKIKIIFNIV